MSGNEFVPPPAYTPEDIQRLANVAARNGIIATTEWDVRKTVDVIREQVRRHRDDYMVQQAIFQGGLMADELLPLLCDAPERFGEALMMLAALLGPKVYEGATGRDLVSIISAAGYRLHQGEMP